MSLVTMYESSVRRRKRDEISRLKTDTEKNMLILLAIVVKKF